MKNIHTYVELILLAFVLFSCSDSPSKKEIKPKSTRSVNEKIEQPLKKEYLLSFEDVQAKYKRLIPVAGGYFITHTKIDSAFYCEFLIEKHNEFGSNEIKIIKTVYNTIITNELRLSEITSEIEKWGLIDSSGRVLIPFVCDGIKLDDNNFKVSILSNLQNLNTGLVRFVYVGKMFQVSQKDWKWRNGNVYHQVLKGNIPAYFHEHVIYDGPTFFIN